MLTHLITLVITGLLWTGPTLETSGQDNAPAAREERPETVTRVYPVSGLLRSDGHGQTIVLKPNVQILPAAGGGQRAVPAEATINVAAADPESALQQVRGVIVQTVATETWADNGGEVGRIVFFQDKLIITHTPAVHQEIGQLLEALQGDQVLTVRALLVRAAEAQVSSSIELAEGVALWKGEPTELETVASVRFSGFEGKPNRASDGRRVTYIANVVPVVAADAVGYQTTTAQQPEGLSLNVVPRLSEDGRTVTVEIEATYGFLVSGGRGEPTTQPAADGVVVLPDLLTVDEKRIETTLRIPAGRWVLVGSIQSSRDGQPTEEPPLHLLLRIEGAQ